jgi:hypothetical protein
MSDIEEYSLLPLHYLEWIKFVDSCIIRINTTRIMPVKETFTQNDYNNLMNNFPDISDIDDGSMIILKLKQNYLESLQPINDLSLAPLGWLNLTSVKSFIPVTERGGRLLFPEAERLGVKLESPIYQSFFNEWSYIGVKEIENYRGVKFVDALDLSPLNKSFLPVEIENLFPNLLDNACEKLSLGTGTIRKLTFVAASGIFKHLHEIVKNTNDKDQTAESKKTRRGSKDKTGKQAKIIKPDKNDDNQIIEINSFIKSNEEITKFLSKDDSNLPLFNNFYLVSSLYKLNRMLTKYSASNISIFFYLIIFYYTILHLEEIEININHVFSDLYILKELAGNDEVANAAYHVGKLFSNKQVTTLLQSRNLSSYPLLISKVNFSLDISDYPPKGWKVKDILTEFNQEKILREDTPKIETDVPKFIDTNIENETTSSTSAEPEHFQLVAPNVNDKTKSPRKTTKSGKKTDKSSRGGKKK